MEPEYMRGQAQKWSCRGLSNGKRGVKFSTGSIIQSVNAERRELTLAQVGKP